MLQGCLSLIVIAIILVLILGMCGRNSTNSSTSEPVDEQLVRVRFVRVCHELITEQLKAPKTAQFREGLDETEAITEDGDNLKLNSHVDAENSFGALIRAEFSCSYTRATDMVRGKLL